MKIWKYRYKYRKFFQKNYNRKCNEKKIITWNNNLQYKTKTIWTKEKIFLNKNPKIKKFLHFSVFLNINNRLYISGGKDKEEKCLKDFYSYHYYTNT